MSREYSKELTKASIALVAQRIGFTITSEATLESLADVVREFIETSSTRALELSECSGRAVPGIQDVLPVLDPDWRELKDFAFEDAKNPHQRQRWHEPFPFHVPNFPIAPKEQKIVALGDRSQGDHVPSHLPMYPPSHTYKQTTVGTKSKKRSVEMIMTEDSKKQSLDAKRIQMSLVRLEQRAEETPTA
jgi:hypothetical protein